MNVRIVSRTISVEWTFDGYHQWPGATPGRSYLAAPHRHRFTGRCTVPVDHDDRAVEFHDLLDYCAHRYAPLHDFGAASCEAIANDLTLAVLERFGSAWCEVSIGEDGYVHGTVRMEREDPQQ